MEINIGLPVRLEDDLTDLERWHEGRLILINKPLDWTSFDLVNRLKLAIRHGLYIRKIKLGHAGTLDPKATGLMILLSGKYTKLTDQIHTFDKSYEAVIYIGATTPCYDTERDVDAVYPTVHITDELILETSKQFIGRIEQIPPIFSAVKINGKKAYESAHRGKEVVTRARMVEILSLDITRIEMPYIHLSVRCSTGTYIRTLAHDLGKALGAGAYLHSLRRTAIGPWMLDQALDIERFAQKIQSYHTPSLDQVPSI